MTVNFLAVFVSSVGTSIGFSFLEKSNEKFSFDIFEIGAFINVDFVAGNNFCAEIAILSRCPS